MENLRSDLYHPNLINIAIAGSMMILTQRMIMLSFSVYDGIGRKKNELNETEKYQKVIPKEVTLCSRSIIHDVTKFHSDISRCPRYRIHWKWSPTRFSSPPSHPVHFSSTTTTNILSRFSVVALSTKIRHPIPITHLQLPFRSK